MKTIIIAAITGMICFQSCTKENKILPTEVQNSLSVNSSSADSKLGKGTNWCGTTVVASKTTSKTDNPGQTPPIYIPKYELASH